MIDNEKRGLVTTGMTLLLVLPALLLSTTFLVMTRTGGETTGVNSLTDKAAYTASDIKRTIRDLKESGKRVDSEVLTQISEKYEDKTIFDNINLTTEPFNIKTEVTYNGDTYIHKASSRFCEIKNLGPNKWYYNFEDLQNWTADIDKDFNEPLLKLLRLENGDWKVTVMPTYSGGATATVYWDNKVIFWNVNSDDSDGVENETDDGTMVGGAGRHEGESKIITGVSTSALAHIDIQDPNGIVHYEETFPISIGGGVSSGGGGGGGGDTTPPSAPTGLSATAVSSSEIDLSWDANTESDLDHYSVYRSTSSGFTADSTTKIDDTTSNSYSDTGLNSSTTYYYKVTAIDTSGNESNPSLENNATTGSGFTPPDDVDDTISAPFTYEDPGDLWWRADDLGDYINSWSLELLEINGEDFTNQYVSTGDLPTKVNGYYYIHYVGNYGWSHFEAGYN